MILIVLYIVKQKDIYLEHYQSQAEGLLSQDSTYQGADFGQSQATGGAAAGGRRGGGQAPNSQLSQF